MNDNNEFKGIDFSEYNTHPNESDIDFSKNAIFKEFPDKYFYPTDILGDKIMEDFD